MVRRCCVPSCRNSRASRKDVDERPRVTFFKAPSEPGLYEHWARVIAERGRGELGKTSVVCERHFPEEEIRRQAVLKDSDGNVIFQKPLTKYYLMKNAVPSIFHEDFDEQTVARRKRKRKKVMPDYIKLFNNTENFTFGCDGNFDINYSDILMALNESENNALQFSVMADNNSQPPIVSLDPKGKEDQNYANHMENNHDPSIHQHKVQIPIKITSQLSDLDGSNLEEPKEITILIPEEEMMLLNQQSQALMSMNVDQTVNVEKKKKVSSKCKQSNVHYPLPESEIQMNIRTFDFIFYNSHKIKLPNAMWGYHKNSIDKNIIIFSKAKWLKSDVSIPPVYEKQVIFHESDSIKIYINSKFSPLEALRRPRSVDEMELILRGVDETQVCSGGPTIGESEAVHCAQKDHVVRRWRHKLCPIVVQAGETTCKFCLTVNQVLRYPKKKRLHFGRRPAAPAAPQDQEEPNDEDDL